MHQTTQRLPDRQQGAALFMALIFLLIMTILGVFGMNISRMENLMAGNNQFQTTALNNAELVIAEGEQIAETITLATLPFGDLSDTGDGYYDHSLAGLVFIDPHELNWSFDFEIPTTVPDSRFVVEYYGVTNRSGGNRDWMTSLPCTSSDCAWIFVVTAQSDTSRGAKRTVQSVYITETDPWN